MKPRERILVTGGGGYLGSVLCPVLESFGHSVFVCDLGWNGTDHIRYPIIADDYRILSKQELGNFTAIIHLACISRTEIESEQEDAILSNHRDETDQLVSKLVVQKLIYASSASVYGSLLYDERLAPPHVGEIERCEARPICEYGYQKYLTEGVAESYGGTSLRMGTLMGSSSMMRHELLVNKMVKDALHEKEMTLFGEVNWRPVLHVRDAAMAYVWALHSYRTNRGIYNLSNDNHQIKYMADRIQWMVRRLYGFCVPVRREPVDSTKQRNYCMDNKKIIHAGFTASTSLDETITELCVYYS